MKPFTGNGRFSSDQVQFNYHFSRACIVVENTFGRRKVLDVHITHVPTVIAACAVLHNKYNDVFEKSWLLASTEHTL